MKQLAIFFLSVVVNAFAGVEGKYCVYKIEDALQKALEIKSRTNPKIPVVVWDIDQTLIITERISSFTRRIDQGVWLRENEYTKKAVSGFNDNGFRSLVITARLRGQSLENGLNESAEKSLNKTKEDLAIAHLRLNEYGLIARDIKEEISFFDRNSIIAHGSLIFAGERSYGNVKGYAATFIMDNPIVTTKATDLYVIDDNFEQLNNYESSFLERRENLYLFHYPYKTTCAQGFEEVY